MADYYAQRIHRAEYDPTKVPESRKQRCQILLKTPTTFKNAVKRATPTPSEACEFEKIQVGSGYERGAREIAQSKGWDLLGCGIHRCGIKVRPGMILKLAFDNTTSRGANQYEVATYNIADDRVKEVFTPVVSHSPTFKWIVVPEARTKENDSLGFEKLKEIVNDVEGYLGNIGAQCTDLHHGNIGLLDDKPVIIDFGFGVVCKRRAVTREAPPARRLSEFPQRESLAVHRATEFERQYAPPEEATPPSTIDRAPSETTARARSAISEFIDQNTALYKDLLSRGVLKTNAFKVRRDMIKRHALVRELMDKKRFTEAYGQVQMAKQELANVGKAKRVSVPVPPEAIYHSATGPTPESEGGRTLISNLIHENAQAFRELPDDKRTNSLWNKVVDGNTRARALMNNDKMTGAYAEALAVKKLLIKAKKAKPARKAIKRPARVKAPKKLAREGALTRRYRLLMEQADAYRNTKFGRSNIGKALLLERAAAYFAKPKYDQPIPSSVDLSVVLSLLSPTRRSEF